MNKRFAFFCTVMLSLCLSAGAACAQIGGQRVEGTIVSVRADILQIRPRFSTELTRVVLDDKTQIQSPQMMAVDKLQPGMRVVAMCDYDGKTAAKVRFIMSNEERSGFFSGKMSGIRGVGYGNSAFMGGVLKSAKPFVVTDDNSQDLTAELGGFVPVMRMTKRGRDALLVGQMITASGQRTADGLLRARSIDIGGGGFGGGGGTLFGEVVAVNGGMVEVRPRFSEDTVKVAIAPDATIRRQITIDPDTVKVGDLLTVQGKRTSGTSDAPTAMVASVLLVGKQSYPKVSGGGFFAMMQGAGGPDLEFTGKVASLSPFVLTREDGQSITVTVPGQVPVVDLRAASLGDFKPGDKIMIMGTEGKEGGLTAKTLLLGASPIVGFGG